MTPRLSIIVPTYNRWSVLKDCLRSLQAQTLSDIDVIVVDNASTDGSVEMTRDQFPAVRVIVLRRNTGFAFACNSGMREARTDYIAVLNNDAEADPQWAASQVEFLDRNGDAGFCASRVVLSQRPELVDSCGDFYAREGVAGKVGHLEPADRFDNVEEVFGAAGSAAVYRRELLREVGGFDEDFYLVHEDTDLSFRARLMGYRCYFVPTAVVRHHLSLTIGYGSPVNVYYASRNQEFVYLKDMPGPLLWRYFALHLLANCLQLGAHAPRGRAKPWLQGKHQAMRSIPDILGKRKEVQQSARVSPDSIDQILFRGWAADAIRRRKDRRRAYSDLEGDYNAGI